MAFGCASFEGRRDIIGRTLLVNGQTFTIDGVAAPDFRGVREMIVTTDLWIPVESWLQLQPSLRASMERRDLRGDATIFARLRPGVPLAQAAVEAESMGRELAQKWPESNRYLTGDTYAVLADLDRSNRNLTGIGVLLLGILLAVACANLAGILSVSYT